MYSKVLAELCSTVRKYGSLTHLLTSVFFYGMQNGDEISIALETGTTLVIRLAAIGETDKNGEVGVFERNGQPPIVKAPNRAAVATLPE
jgi:pyruvate carboxylase